MDIRLNEEQQMLQQTFAEFFRARFTDAVARQVEHDRGADVDGQPHRGWRPELWQELVGLGALQPTIPEDAGGLAMGQLAAALIAEQMGRVLYTSPYGDTLTAADLIVQAGRGGNHWALLERLAGGATVALAVRDNGRNNPSRLAAVELVASPAGDGWQASGQKRFVPFARHVDYLLLTLATSAGPTLFLIPRRREGIVIRRHDDLGRGELCSVDLRATPLAAGDVLGTVGQAELPYANALARARIRHGAYLVGLCQGALDVTLEYTKQRRQFGRSIASFQTISFRLAALTARTEALRWLIYRLAWEADQGLDSRRLAAQSLALAGDLACELAAEAVQMHGAYGFCEESEIQRYYRRAAVDAVVLATPAELRDEAMALLATEDAGYSWRGITDGERPPAASRGVTPNDDSLPAPASSSPQLTRPAPRQGAQDTAATFPASFGQQRFWLLEQLHAGQPVYNENVIFELHGPLQVAHLEQSLTAVMERHATLRTTFRQVEGRLVQVVAAGTPRVLTLVDLAGLASPRRDREVRRQLTAEVRRRFDLEHGPLLRMRLLRLSATEHVLALVVHHVAIDIWSIDILLQEVTALYAASLAGQPSPLPELPLQYADFAVWERQWLQGERLEKQLAYWRDQFRGELPVVALPTDHRRPAVPSFRGALARRPISGAIVAPLQALRSSTGNTLFTIVLAVFKILLFRYTGKKDIVVGTPVVNRNQSGTQALIGIFTNTLAVRTHLTGDDSFQQLSRQMQSQLLDALDHQELPFDYLVEMLQPERSTGQVPLFQQMFIFLQGTRNMALPGIRSRSLVVHNATTKFDLSLVVEEEATGLSAQAEYSVDLFEPSTITRLLSHFESLLAAVATDCNLPLAALPLLTAGESQQLLVEWNDTAGTTAEATAIHELFEIQARRTPRALALVAGECRLDYAELNHRADRLAAVLRAHGVGPEIAVGIFLSRSERLVVAVLAVLKAGGAYVPLDPAYPQERIAYILATVAAPLVLSEKALAQRLPGTAAVLRLDDGELTAAALPPRPAISPRQLAYVIFTSGSTGRPKGVAIEHRSALQLLAWARQSFTPQELAGLMAATSICFDLSVFELFTPLSWGGTVVLAQDALHLAELTHTVRLVNTVPSAMAEILRLGALSFGPLTVSLAGEVLTRSLVERLYATGQVEWVWNLYGPSEDTTYSTGVRVPPGTAAEPTIGRPLTGTRAYVLDRGLRPLPTVVPGELCLTGTGLARGYFANPQQTAASFVPDPFSDQLGTRLYRTGDLARYRGDGELEFLGRMDQQVKLRGFRIELGEIESVLQTHPAISEAVVLARTFAADDQRLVAYLVTADSGVSPPAVDELRASLRRRLPEYMLPAAFVFLASLPRTPSGKIDRRGLPQPETDTAAVTETYVAPRSPREVFVADLFARVLQHAPIGIHDNFFDAGGYSLLGMRVISEIEREFNVMLTLRTLLERPTVATLTAAIEETMLAAVDPQEMARLIAELEETEAD